MTHKELVKIGADWLLKKAPGVTIKCQYAVSEFTTASYESPDVFGIRSGQTVLIEVKVSRGDFLADKKKHFRTHDFDALGNQRFYLTPTDLVRPEEVGKWGLLYCDGEKISIVKESEWFKTERNQEMNLMYSILRRLLKPGLKKKKKNHINSL